MAFALMVTLAGPAQAAANINPADCPSPTTRAGNEWRINGSTWRMDVRYSAGCQAGWVRTYRTSGVNGLEISQSVWNPGGPSYYGVPGTNWTYTADAPRGRQVCGGFHAWYRDGLGRRIYAGWYYAGCYTA